MPAKYSTGDDTSNKVVKYNGTEWEETSEVGNINSDNIYTQPAPTGVQWCLSKMVQPVSYKSAWNDDSVTFYYGSLKLSKMSDGSGLECASIKIPVSSSDTFTLLRRTITGRQLALNCEKVMVYDPSAKLDLADIEKNAGTKLNIFDWQGFKLSETLDNADNTMTKVTVFVIQIIPRIVMYICILLIALSLMTNVKPWVLFCDKVFDVYSFITFGKHTVHTIDMRGIFFSSLVGIGVFWLFMDGSIFDLFGWIVRAVLGIASK